MKVIGKSNFDDEFVSDYLVKEGLTEAEATALAKELNDQGNDHSKYFYRAVEDGYVLYEFEP